MAPTANLVTALMNTLAVLAKESSDRDETARCTGDPLAGMMPRRR